MKTPEQDFPWWLLVAGGLGALAFGSVLAEAEQRQVLATLLRGVRSIGRLGYRRRTAATYRCANLRVGPARPRRF